MNWLFKNKQSRNVAFDIACYQDKGGRPIQEDSIGTFQKDGKYGFVLCDGLGGHGMGDVASSIVVSVFQAQFEKADKLRGFLDDAFEAAQEIVMQEQRSLKAQEKMKTTAVMMATDRKKAYIGHIGDSRLYLFSGGKILLRTLDHSIPQMLVLSHEIEEKDIRFHPERNILLRVIGVEWDERMYQLMDPLPLAKFDAALLCSDGFWELIEEKEMETFLQTSSTVDEWLMKMRSVVQANGKGKEMDNNSAIAVMKNKRKE